MIEGGGVKLDEDMLAALLQLRRGNLCNVYRMPDLTWLACVRDISRCRSAVDLPLGSEAWRGPKVIGAGILLGCTTFSR